MSACARRADGPTGSPGAAAPPPPSACPDRRWVEAPGALRSLIKTTDWEVMSNVRSVPLRSCSIARSVVKLPLMAGLVFPVTRSVL